MYEASARFASLVARIAALLALPLLLFSSGTYAVPNFARQTDEAGVTPFKIGDTRCRSA